MASVYVHTYEHGDRVVVWVSSRDQLEPRTSHELLRFTLVRPGPLSPVQMLRGVAYELLRRTTL